MDVRRLWRRLYLAVVLVPFLLNAAMVATHHPAHPYFRGREVLLDIARDAGRDPESYDVVLVHHWWMAQFYYYALAEPEKVRLLGRTMPAVEDLKNIPGDARVLLIVNDIATRMADPKNEVVDALERQRPLIGERPCLYPSLAGAGLVCERILLFGPEY